MKFEDMGAFKNDVTLDQYDDFITSALTSDQYKALKDEGMAYDEMSEFPTSGLPSAGEYKKYKDSNVDLDKYQLFKSVGMPDDKIAEFSTSTMAADPYMAYVASGSELPEDQFIV